MIIRLFNLVISGITLWIIGLGMFVYFVTTMDPYRGEAEGIVVLTGGDGRVEAGLKLLEAGRAKRLLISGVHANVKISELIKLNHQDPALIDRIDLGFAAQDTSGNADETAAWVEKNKVQSMIVVTAHYHMPRAMVHLGAQLPDVALYPYPVTPSLFQDKLWYKNPAARNLMINDYNKFLLTYPQILFLKE